MKDSPIRLVTPYPHQIEVFTLHNGRFVLAGGYTVGDTLSSPLFPELRLDLDRIFDFPLDPGEKVEMVKEGRPVYASVTESIEGGES